MMHEKYNENYENQIVLLAGQNVKKGKFDVFDNIARVITRDKFPELVQKGRTDNESCLVIINKEGKTMVITEEFEIVLRNALKRKL